LKAAGQQLLPYIKLKYKQKTKELAKVTSQLTKWYFF